MIQRGRKSRAAISVLPAGPHLVPPQTADERPPPPDHLGDVEKKIWLDVTSEFSGSRSSLRVLTTGLEAHQRARECRDAIDAEGLTIVGRDGQSKAHPLLAAEREARKQFMVMFKTLGIKL
jgi:P27 family predicted phage terminase small subunit